MIGLSCIQENWNIWALANDWESLLIRNPAYPNAKQVLAVMVVSQEIHNHKVICYLNKQSVCISYENISRQNIIWEVAVLGEDSGTTSLLKRVPTHSSIDNVVQIFSNLICLLVTVIHVNQSLQILGTFSPWNNRINCTQSVGCRVQNPFLTLKRIINHNCWGSVSSWTGFGQLLEDFFKQRGISLYWWVPRLTLTSKYLVLIHKKLW